MGFALLLVGVGALVSMRATGQVFDRHGGKTTASAVAALGLAGMLPGLARSFWALGLTLLVLGASSGATDVAINAEGVHAEEVSGRPLLNLAHAAFSASVVAASLLVGVLRAVGSGPEVTLALAGASVLVIAASLGRSVPQAALGRRPRQERPPSRRTLRPPTWLLALGAMTALAYWVENAWQSWSAVHLAHDLGASAGVSALGPAAFASAAAIGRLFGNRLIRILHHRGLITAGATVAAAGTALAASAANVPIGVAGILLAGAGTSVCAPTIISLAGALAPQSQRGIAISTVTTIAYLGFLVGPAAVGGIAALTSLRTSLTVVSGLAIVLALTTALGPLPTRRRGLAAEAEARARWPFMRRG